jgi:hypothetical protein
LVPIYRHEWCHQLQLFFNNGGCQPLTFGMGAHGWCSSSCCICQWMVLSINGCCTLMTTNNHPLCHSCGATVLLLLQHRLASSALPSLPFWKHLWPSLQVLATPFNHQSHQSTPFLTQKGSLQPDGLPHHIWRVLSLVSRTYNIPLRAYQPCSVRNDFIKPYTKAYNTPSNRYSKCDSHYLSISIWSRAHHSSNSLLIQELRLPSVPP